jgi:hypothetical protein
VPHPRGIDVGGDHVMGREAEHRGHPRRLPDDLDLAVFRRWMTARNP